MKSSEKLTFPELQNEYLENIVRQLVHQYTIIQMFFTRAESSAFSQLIIHIENCTDIPKLNGNKWVIKVKKRYHIDVHFIYSSKLKNRFSSGHPFIEYYCRSAASIYQNKDSEDLIVLTSNWKKFKKTYNMFQEHFFHDHDLHNSQVTNLILEGFSNTVFRSYARLIEYDLNYLEELYCGDKSASQSIDERINNLIEYIPDIQKYFVRSRNNKFYLTDLLAKAKEAAADDDVIYKEEMYEAIEIAEQSLYSLIEKRLGELKKLIKKGIFEKHEIVCQTDDKPKDIVLQIAIETIVKSIEVEEIYLYHQIAFYEKTTYYLMLIAIGAGNEKLKSITQSLKSKIGEKCDFILISHSRYWIQTNLYQNQSFFANIIERKFLIYSSSNYHPEFHWEAPHIPYHADLYFFYYSTKGSAMQFFTIVNNSKENYFGLDFIFAMFFLSFCRTYIYVKTYYTANNLPSQVLWGLCIYADAKIKKYNYLIEEFWTDFFPYLDKHTILYHKFSKLKKEEALQMNVIVEKLMFELHNLVIEGGLLSSFEQD